MFIKRMMDEENINDPGHLEDFLEEQKLFVFDKNNYKNAPELQHNLESINSHIDGPLIALMVLVALEDGGYDYTGVIEKDADDIFNYESMQFPHCSDMVRNIRVEGIRPEEINGIYLKPDCKLISGIYDAERGHYYFDFIIPTTIWPPNERELKIDWKEGCEHKNFRVLADSIFFLAEVCHFTYCQPWIINYEMENKSFRIGPTYGEIPYVLRVPRVVIVNEEEQEDEETILANLFTVCI